MAIASATAGISSTFTISSIWPTEQGTVTITNPGRTFRVLAVLVTGTATSIMTVRKNTVGGVTVAVGTADVTNEPIPAILTTANVDFLATDNVHITVGTAAATQVDVLCVATGGGEALTTAVT